MEISRRGTASKQILAVCRRKRLAVACFAWAMATLLCTGQLAGQQGFEWTGSWSAAQQSACSPADMPHGSMAEATLRETVHLSLGGDAIRLRFSNQYGSQLLVLNTVRVAPAEAGKPGLIQPNSTATVLFKGLPAVTIAPGAQITSDALPMRVQQLSSLTISIDVSSVPACLTGHLGARTTSFLLPGAHADDQRLDGAETFVHWYFLSAVEVAGPGKGAVAVVGDSITDGRDSTTDGNNRWTDALAQKLAPSGTGVLNFGIGGNQILGAGLGPNAVSRFDRDVLGATGVHWVILFEGVNDLGVLDRLQEHAQADHDALVGQLEAALKSMAEKAHGAGMCAYAATVMPYAGSNYYHPSARTEGDRIALNRWIRTSNVFDAVIDFDKMMSDPQHPDHLAASAGSADGLHPGPAGYRMMGAAVPSGLFQKRCTQ